MSEQSKHDPRPRFRTAIFRFGPVQAAVAYLLLTLAITWPLPLNFTTHIAGNPNGDSWVSLWMFSWVKSSVLEGHTIPLQTDRIGYPPGGTIYVLELLDALLAIPSRTFCALGTSYNLILVFLMTLAPFATWLLVRHVTGSAAAAFVSGVVYGYCPYFLASIFNGSTETLNTGWIPLYVLALFRLKASKSYVWALPVGLLLFVAGFSCWYYAAFCCLFTALFFLYHLAVDKPKRRPLIVQGAIVTLVFGLAIAPFARLLGQSLGAKDAFVGKRKGTRYAKYNPHWRERSESADLVNFVLPGKLHRRGEAKATLVYPVTYIGWIALLLGGLAVRHRAKERRFWFVALALFFLLSLGPSLRVAGHGLRIPMLHALFDLCVPFYSKLELVYRFTILIMLALSVLGGYGLCTLMQRFGGRGKAITALLASSLVLAEFLIFSPAPFPLPLIPTTVPDYLHELAKEPDRFAVLDVPIVNLNHIKERYIYFQTAHHKRIPYCIETLMSRTVEMSPLVHHLRALSRDPLRDRQPADLEAGFQAGLSTLTQLGYRYLLVHEDLMDEETGRDVHDFLEGLVGRPRRRVGEIVVYELAH